MMNLDDVLGSLAAIPDLLRAHSVPARSHAVPPPPRRSSAQRPRSSTQRPSAAPPRTPARLLVFKTAAQSETTSPVVDPQGVTYAADRFGARRGRGLAGSNIYT